MDDRVRFEALSAAVARARPADLEQVGLRLRDAFAAFDESGVHELLDAAFVGHPVDRVVDGLVFPFLRLLGEAWERGEISVAQEHWASNLLRSRLMALAPELAARRAGAPVGTAVLACPAHERHDIGLLALDLVLRERGWDCVFLGADTPVESAVELSRARRAGVLVLSGNEPHMYDAQLDLAADDLHSLTTGSAPTRLALAGRAATPEQAARHGGVLLPLATVPAAEALEGVVLPGARVAP